MPLYTVCLLAAVKFLPCRLLLYVKTIVLLDLLFFVVLDSRTGSQVLARFMGVVMGGRVKFEPSQVVLTAGATPTIEILAFSLAQPGEAFLVPSPYYPGCVIFLDHSSTYH